LTLTVIENTERLSDTALSCTIYCPHILVTLVPAILSSLLDTGGSHFESDLKHFPAIKDESPNRSLRLYTCTYIHLYLFFEGEGEGRVS